MFGLGQIFGGVTSAITSFLLGFLPQEWRDRINGWMAQWDNAKAQISSAATTAISDIARQNGIDLNLTPDQRTRTTQSTPTTPVSDPQTTTAPEAPPPTPPAPPNALPMPSIFGAVP